ncbi:MAG: Secretion system C-terminal sorting domain, partial [Bacteroidota bacterium]
TENKEQLVVYPNPAEQYVVVSSAYSVNTMSLINVLGQKQNCSISQYSLHNTYNYKLNTENLPSGIYFIKATDSNGNQLNGKFVKQ